MVQWLRALSAHAEEPEVSILSTDATLCNISCRGSDALLWPLWALHAYALHSCRQNIHPHNIKINKALKQIK